MERTYGQLMDQVTVQTDQIVKQVLPEGTQTDQQKTQLAAFRAKVNGLMARSMSWDVLEPDYVTLYAQTYTEQDLEGMIAFYQSPVGQKMLDKTPELLKASSAIAMTRLSAVYPQLQKLMEDFEQQMKSGQGAKN